MAVSILIGDVFTRLAEMPDESVQCVVTSPPYWGLRDYGVEGQIGLEPTIGEHLEIMVKVFAEIRRVLRKDGTVWLNYGDCYATSPNGRSAADTKTVGNDDRTFRDKPFSTVGPIYSKSKRMERGSGRWGGGNNSDPSLKAKDLCMVPNRLAIALQEDGWWVRSEIIWAKPNPMPESVTDRPASSHEKIFLLSKSAKYHYDAESVREAAQPSSVARWNQDVEKQLGSDRAHAGAKTNGNMKAVGGPHKTKIKKERVSTPRHKGHIQHTKLDEIPAGGGRNMRNVWTIATRPFSEAHFATFPPALVEPCIKAGCPVGGLVLDPFGGAGTVGLVADRLGRDAILIELNPEYAEIARKRIEGDAPMLAKIEVFDAATIPKWPAVGS